MWALGSFLRQYSSTKRVPYSLIRFSARVGSGVFSTDYPEAPVENSTRFQRPCGLWGLFYAAFHQPLLWFQNTTSFSARVGSGVFSTVVQAEYLALGNGVSAPVWALGSFLLEFETVERSGHIQFQRPCGLWGLFYLPTSRQGCLPRPGFQRPCGLWGLFYTATSPVTPTTTATFQRPCGLWGLFYRGVHER